MIPRRFINLIMKDLRVGGSYWLSRLRPEENLFYASTKEAVASETQARGKRRKPIYGSANEMPSPSFRFKSARSFDSKLVFMPFYGLDGGPSEGRIVVSDSAGHTHLYDAEEVSGEMLPPNNESANWHSPISVCIAKDGIRADTLYAINSSNSTSFRSLAYCNGDTMAWKWVWQPPPPYIFSGKEDETIQSHTLLQDNKTICFSSDPDGGFGTYCFDTASKEWTKAGSWTLPFIGRALRVPQLYNLYFGFLDSNPGNLIALELPSPPLERPKVLHQWPGFGPPDKKGDWSLMDSKLLYLGNHRFCIFKWFALFHGSDEPSENILDMVAVLTGVEIVNGQPNKAKLQMIKHKTRNYLVDDCSIEAVM